MRILTSCHNILLFVMAKNLSSYFSTRHTMPPKEFPPWESNIPILGRKISHLGNSKAVRLIERRTTLHETADQRPRDGVSKVTKRRIGETRLFPKLGFFLHE